MQFQQLQSVVFAKLVQKVGDKRYWEQWAKSVGEIAQRQVERISKLVREDTKHQKAFDEFIKGLHKNINPSITQSEAIDMLSQHIITKPVFDALFEDYSFVRNNPVSQSMQRMLDLLEAQSLEKDTEVLRKFYESVKMRASGIDNAEGKQRIIIELYDKFFKTAFPKMVEKLGIVYTPIEVVDFIIHSVNDILIKEFGRSISDENIHILDPFTGTGTFITRLLQSGLIQQKDLERKYKHEIHANEIVLLAYYIAAVNIENAYHDQTPDPDDGIGTEKYLPFEGIVLTDTFQLGETDDGEKLFSEMFPKNSERVQRQQKAPLKVIIGNPPYSIGHKSANDNAQNQQYLKLDKRISNTYAKLSEAGLNKSLYDAYIKAFRWSTDRLDKEDGGIVAFITNGNWLDKPSLSGFRYYLEKEFTSVYVVNLRGGIRGKSTLLAKKEGQNIFDILTGVAITILVKNPAKNNDAEIYYHDIGEYLKRKDKLSILKQAGSILSKIFPNQRLNPDSHYDWLNLRDDSFDNFIPLIPAKKYDYNANSFFVTNAIGVVTNRDSWVYGSSYNSLIKKITAFITKYNSYLESYHNQNNYNSDEFIEKYCNDIKWTVNLNSDFKRNKKLNFKQDNIIKASYRPFNLQHLYYDKSLIERPGTQNTFFKQMQCDDCNKVIAISGEVRKEFSVCIVSIIADLEVIGRGQYLPLYFYEEGKFTHKGLFDIYENEDYTRRDGITDFIFEKAKKQYGNNVTKEDIFYYVYGFLHSKEYRETFANDLKKMLPRLPLVEDVRDFWAFSKAGRKLAELHLNYESVPAYPDVKVSGDESQFYIVEKMRFPKKGQKDTIIYNSKITVSNIPAKAYEYVINGRSAIEWIMERYQVTVHKESGIKNDPNDWSREHDKPRYILDLLLSIINVSIQTVDIVNGLPKLKFD